MASASQHARGSTTAATQLAVAADATAAVERGAAAIAAATTAAAAPVGRRTVAAVEADAGLAAGRFFFLNTSTKFSTKI